MSTEIDRLTRELATAEAQVAHLQEAIRGAPHGRMCSSLMMRWACPDHGTDVLTADRRCAGCEKLATPLPDLPCDCWKASVLKGAAAPAVDALGVRPAADGKHGICIDKKNALYGWVLFRHPDGQWVSLRKATDDELAAAERV